MARVCRLSLRLKDAPATTSTTRTHEDLSRAATLPSAATGAPDAGRGVGCGGQAPWRDRVAAVVAGGRGALVEFGERAFDPCFGGFERAADADLAQARDRFGGAVSDALAEA